jgi:bifunctional non-homologous end joining protein LigD
MSGGEEGDGGPLTNLDQPLFDGAEATKRDLVDYLDAISDRIIPELADRPLTVKRVRAGQDPVHAEECPEVHPGVGCGRPPAHRARHS